MAEKKITRKVISKVSPSVKKPEEVAPQTEDLQKVPRAKRVCFFCQNKTNPSYTDTSILRRFTTDRVKIVARAKSNLCSKHQRLVSKQIKYARHLALLPFIPKV